MIFGFIWWIVVLAAILVTAVTGLLAVRNTIGAFALFVIGTIGIVWLNGTNPFFWVLENPDLFFTGIGGYALAGILVGFIKFVLYANSDDMKALIKASYARWQASGDVTPFKESHFNPMGFQKDFPRIVGWVFFWPFVLLLTLGGDLLVHLVTWLGRKFSGVFGMVASSAIDNALKSK